VRQIGAGSTAIVYLANDQKTKKEVALKVEKAETTVSNNHKRFEQEAKLLVDLDNKNIVKAYDIFREDKATIIVMEYLKGFELQRYLTQKVKIEAKEAAGIILQIINALKDLHAQGAMHRDLKPQNIFMTPEGTIKLMDFGIAQVSEDQDLTRHNSVIGTVGYMAPELLTKKVKANPKTEIYALGVVLYKMIIGYLPFSGDSDLELAGNIINGTASVAKEVDNKIDSLISDVVSKMMARNYINRYQTLGEVENVLKAYINGTLTEVDTGSSKKTKGLFRRRKEA
jgi:serine/threonine-protein kinase